MSITKVIYCANVEHDVGIGIYTFTYQVSYI